MSDPVSGFKVQGSEFGVPDGDGDRAMASTYIRVVVLEGVILIVLWLLGRAFS
jgi:hypothetical protein